MADIMNKRMVKIEPDTVLGDERDWELKKVMNICKARFYFETGAHILAEGYYNNLGDFRYDHPDVFKNDDHVAKFLQRDIKMQEYDYRRYIVMFDGGEHVWAMRLIGKYEM